MIEHRPIIMGGIIACSLMLSPASLAQESEGGDEVTDLPPAAQHDRFQIVTIDRVWTSAERRRDQEAERAADARLDLWLTAELAEAEQAAAAARAEADEEAAESGRVVDRHAARDDQRDARRQLADLDRLISLVRELKTLQPSFVRGNATRSQYARKRIILRDLVQLARVDVRDSRQESVEDTADTGRTRRQNRR